MKDNSFYELLHAFLDGELSAHQTELFFRELARSPERQRLFTDHVKLQNSLRYGLASEPAMPDNAFSAIAGKVGLSAPDPVVTPVKRSTFSWRMLRNPAIAASLSVLMLILFLMPGASWLFPEEENTTTPLAAEQPLHHNSKATLPVDKAVLSAENKTTSVPISKVKVQEQKTPAYAAVQSLRTVVNEELNDIAVNKTTNNDNGMTESVIIPTNLSFVPNQQLLQMPISMPIVFNPAMQIPQNPISLPAQRLFGGKIELGVRGTSFASRSFPSPEISPLTDPPLNNIAFSVQYNISEEHSISFEAGQESFRQEFYRLEGNDSLAYKQHLLDGWGAVGYRFSPNDLSLSNTLRPFAKISIGATSVGALARLGIGISADLTQQLSCQIQAEGTGLWYNVEGVLFSTRQVGLSYGFSYRL